MRKVAPRLKGVVKMVWHSKHMIVHVLLGLRWATFLLGRGDITFHWVAIATFGSLLPDIEHIMYFLTYGRHDEYTQQLFRLLKSRQWTCAFRYCETGHKTNTKLYYHNFYTVGFLILLCVISLMVDLFSFGLLIGSMVSHYLFDAAEDMALMGRLNPNWKRWGKPRTHP